MTTKAYCGLGSLRPIVTWREEDRWLKILSLCGCRRGPARNYHPDQQLKRIDQSLLRCILDLMVERLPRRYFIA